MRRLNMSATSLQKIEWITLTPLDVPGLSDVEDEETYKLIGMKMMSGDAPERVVVLSAASGDEIVVMRCNHGERGVSILEDHEWRAFLADLALDTRVGTMKRASLICRHLMPLAYGDTELHEGDLEYEEAASRGGGLVASSPQSRRLAIRRRLHCSVWHIHHCFSAISDFVWKIGEAVVDLGKWIGGSAISLFTDAYNKITGFVSQMTALFVDWATRVKEWITDKLRSLMSTAGPKIAEAINTMLGFLDEHLLKDISMGEEAQRRFLTNTKSPLPLNADQVIQRCIIGTQDDKIATCKEGPAMDSVLYAHCKGGTPITNAASVSTVSNPAPPPAPPPSPPSPPSSPPGTGTSDGDFPVKLMNMQIAPCITLDQFVISSDKLGDFLSCLVRDVPAFMNSLFDMAKGAIEGLIDTIKGWIENSSACPPSGTALAPYSLPGTARSHPGLHFA